MSSLSKTWIGADPGGKGNFGIAVLNEDGSTRTFCAGCADEAVEQVCQSLDSAPAGVGVDAPLWWSSGASGDRAVDQWLRKKYRLSGGNVQASNSLRGAALVQGAMFAHRIRQRFPGVGITETHPKALLAAIKMTWSAFAERFAVTAVAVEDREHERDAIISGVAAREGFEGRWQHDLALERHQSELDPATYWLAPIRYFWPE